MLSSPEIPMLAWLVIALLGAGVCAALARTLGAAALAETDAHDLNVEVQALKLEYERRLRERAAAAGEDGDLIEAVPIDEA